MQNGLAEAELSLIHALQLRPRASWAELSAVLEETPATLSARWSRLRAEGLSWVTAYPTIDREVSVGLVEVDIAPGALEQVCAVLDPDPRVATIEHAARGRDLILTVFGRGFADLSATLLDDLSTTPGIVGTRTHLAAAVHLEGSRWTLDALDPGQRAALLGGRPVRPAPGTAPYVEVSSPTNAPLLAGLARDGRASAAQLAAQVGRPESTVRRQLGRLLRSGAVTFRCEVAQNATRFPVCVTWWCRVPADAEDGLVDALRREPRVRLCLSVTGPENFLMTMWTESLPDVMRVQGWLEQRLGGGQIADTSVILRTRKRMGWMLHPDGRATGQVYPPWV